MSKAQFPSGPWIGFYNYQSGGRRHRMDLSLSFSNAVISGDGSDNVGAFVIAGGYDEDSGECQWTKTYVGAHDVNYRGFQEGKGIWGLWNLEGGAGGFHIWPLGDGRPQLETTEEEDVETPMLAGGGRELVPLVKPLKERGSKAFPFS